VPCKSGAVRSTFASGDYTGSATTGYDCTHSGDYTASKRSSRPNNNNAAASRPECNTGRGHSSH